MKDLKLLLEIIQMIKSTPNDQELGKKIRNLFNNLKTKKDENKSRI
jgi:hypothetical protein